MKYTIKQEKGISMVSLIITIIILVILTNMLVYNARDNIHIKALTNLYSDIELLREKVSEYYNEYGEIPAEIQYTNINELSDVLSSKNDTGNFYIIDLEAMQGITLNYGKDYENIKNDKSNVDSYTDIYIINKNSHNIFYVKGISITEDNTTKIYHTDYTEPDEATVDLRYINGLEALPRYAFKNCTKLVSIQIPSFVTSIGYGAFDGCNNLVSINIPSSLTSIDDFAFSGCNNLSSIEIPSSVSKIGSDAFYNCRSLSSIEIPSSVTSIEWAAFSYCSRLTSIKIPSSVTSIEGHAFDGCSSLASIEIPSSVVEV